MEKIISQIVYACIYLVSKLPFRALYALSDVFYYVAYYIVGYRKKVVYKNLKSFFPNKDDKELIIIQKKFYRHFIDTIVEMIKSFTISFEELNKRLEIINPEVLNDLYKQNKSVILMGSHYGNWEWILGSDKVLDHQTVATYSRIQNKFLDHRIKTNRERFGSKLLKRDQTTREVIKNYRNQKLCIYALLCDQSPHISRAYYWSEFLGKRVPMYIGPEYLAKKYDFAVVYMRIDKLKRGNYTCNFDLITDQPKRFSDYEITEIFIDKVESQIKENPAYYLWTHNRLKLAGKEHLKPKKSKLTNN